MLPAYRWVTPRGPAICYVLSGSWCRFFHRTGSPTVHPICIESRLGHELLAREPVNHAA